MKVFIGFVTRVGMKTCIDYTGLLQGRHAYEFGGAYFSFTLLSTLFICVNFGRRYLSIVESDEIRESLP
ncbi:hypothetical protein TrLO_g6066 [Triparma laevis f. longispina]|uniref:Uncharacterized protein n=1 Tax=Triparma laevis f. longispina TaxID=1714387 RepID=A0A9W7C3S8_9STRA|nr:hypothetical protein TrLO_g6066 [Triparma laevis f. longispina]